MRRVAIILLTYPFIALGFVAGLVSLLARLVWAALVEGFLLAWG